MIPRACRIYATVLFAMLTIFQVRVYPVSALAITTFSEAPAGTPVDHYAAMPEKPQVASDVKLPSGPVHMFIRRGEQSRFELFFLDVKYDYDVSDFEFYNAWCLEKDKKIATSALHRVRLYHVDEADLPPKFKATPWDQINYLINHKEGSKTVVQEAIWYLADNRHKPGSPEAVQLIEKAAANGRNFQPGEGQLVAIICLAEGKQAVFIELPIPATTVAEAFPVPYPPPPPMPVLSSLPSWLPLTAVPVIIPFMIPEGSSDSAPSFPSSYTVTPTLASNEMRDRPSESPVNPIPEPSSVLLIATGVVGLCAWGKVRRRGTHRS